MNDELVALKKKIFLEMKRKFFNDRVRARKMTAVEAAPLLLALDEIAAREIENAAGEASPEVPEPWDHPATHYDVWATTARVRFDLTLESSSWSAF